MPCSTCKIQFNLFKRKRSCASCHYYFCSNCLGKQRKNLCIRCEIIHSCSKNELMLLKTKDLICFLQARKININGVVEKEELCNIIINHISSSTYFESIAADSSSTTSDFDQIKQTCQSFFTSFTEKIASDLQKTTCFNQPSQQNKTENVMTQQPTKHHNFGASTSGTNNNNNSSFLQSNNRDEEQQPAEISEKRQVIVNTKTKNLFDTAEKADEADSSNSSFEEVAVDGDWQFVESSKTTQLPVTKQCCMRRRSDSSLMNRRKSLDTDELANIQFSCEKCGKSKSKSKLNEELLSFKDQLNSSNLSEIEKSAKIKHFMEYLDTKFESPMNEENGPQFSCASTNLNFENAVNDNVDTIEESITKNSEPSCSFFSKRFITLEEIRSSDDLESLSVKQLKELLALNRVDFKGCCEKKELKERVQRLWESYANAPSSDRLLSNDLCKICMDAPIECVFLECGHSVTCTACGKVLSECPICRSYIVRVVRIFKS